MDAFPIEDLVQYAKKHAIEYGTKFVLAQIILLTGPIGGFFGPIVIWILENLVEWVVAMLVNNGDKFLFGVDMAIIVSDQGKDYRDAVAEVLRLPDDVKDEVWYEKEMAANHKFAQLNRYAA